MPNAAASSKKLIMGVTIGLVTLAVAGGLGIGLGLGYGLPTSK